MKPLPASAARRDGPACLLRALRRATATTLVAVAPAALAGTTASATAVPYQVFNDPKPLGSLVYEDAHYQHAPTVASHAGRVWVAWNGNLHNHAEARPGQVILLRTSADEGRTWGPLATPFSHSYMALDDNGNRWVQEHGDADLDHRVADQSAMQWQPSLVEFQGRLLMFWGLDRHAPGAAMMMSELEPDGVQWRTSELHFASDGTPRFLPEVGGQAPATADPSTLAFEDAPRWTAIAGAGSLPAAIHLTDLPPALLAQENLGGPDRTATGLVPLAGHRLLPAPNQASVVTRADGRTLLAVSVILEQTVVDWAALAVKIPAVLTTSDLVHWHLSLVPMQGPAGDLLQDPRGDFGLTSAWEPTLDVDGNGNLHVAFRFNPLPPTASGTAAPSHGWRMGSAVGVFQPDETVRFAPARHVDMDVPASRSALLKLPGQSRWVMAANHMVQGAAWDGGVAPVFPADRFDPWARENLGLFFSTRGDDDFVSGVNLSGPVGQPGVEYVHYPALQASGRALLVAYSSRARDATCSPSTGTLAACHHAIHFLRLGALPDPARPALYPNHLASTFAWGLPAPQPAAYVLQGGVLTLHGRGSAGIETPGTSGCVDLRFRPEAPLAPGDTRPVLSFGRSADRTRPIGLALRGEAGGTMRLVLGVATVAKGLAPGAWSGTTLCYDFAAHTLVAGGVTWRLGAAPLSPRSYLGDDTLLWRAAPPPDLSFDVSSLAWHQP